MNYNASANTDFNGLLCTYAILGCTDSTAFNYNINANVDDGSCQPIVFGCTDNTAFNYNSEANIDDGSCIDLVLGSLDQIRLIIIHLQIQMMILVFHLFMVVLMKMH